jgi:uncharacterized phiE125 gp8 family phage protein
MSLRLITAPTTYPVTLAQAQAQTRVNLARDDDYLNLLIAAATDYAEQYTGKAIMEQTWELVLDGFSDVIQIPKGPISSVTSVKYFDAANVEQTISNTNYAVDIAASPAWIVRASNFSWPSTAAGVNNVTIRFIAGYALVPASIKHAILLLIGTWFEQRSAVAVDVRGVPTEIPIGVHALLDKFRPVFV